MNYEIYEIRWNKVYNLMLHVDTLGALINVV